MIVYHGSVYSIERPLANIGRKNLDFGQGFYVTDMKLQAERGGYVWVADWERMLCLMFMNLISNKLYLSLRFCSLRRMMKNGWILL